VSNENNEKSEVEKDLQSISDESEIISEKENKEENISENSCFQQEIAEESENLKNNDNIESYGSENSENTEIIENADSVATDETAENISEKQKIKEFLKKVKIKVGNLKFPDLAMRAIASYFAIMAIFIFMKRKEFSPINDWTTFIEKIPVLQVGFFVIVAFVVLSLIKYAIGKFINSDCAFAVIAVLATSAISIWKANNFYYAMGFLLVTAVVAWFAYRYSGFKWMKKIPKPVVYIISIILMFGTFAYIAVFTLYRHAIYGTACFDMGIFVQMFHYMKETFLPLTTCERDKLLSHFAVHFSPIFYILLPFYYIFPYAETLLVAQAALIATGVIPLLLMCRERKLSNLATLSFSVVYLLSAEMIGPCFYDFHENAFLPPLLMWFFYAIEKRKYVLMYIMMILLVAVKEDVPIYVAIIGIYCIFTFKKKEKWNGVAITAFSVIYFFVVTKLMAKYGEGVMTSRTYGNLMTDQSASFGNIIKTCILNPVYFITQCVNEDNFIFILTVLVPLAFMPFVTKKFSHYFLIIPMLLMNMATGYGYARDINYQYVFGTTACLIYCSMINYAELKSKNKEYVPVFMGCASILVFSSLMGSKTDNLKMYKERTDVYQKRDELLASIPDDASVACDAFYVPHLAQRDEIYELTDSDVSQPSTTDFVIVRFEYEQEWHASEVAKLISEGYTYYQGDSSIMAIYVSPDYVFESEEE
jgi:uncharacterized membrane protein